MEDPHDFLDLYSIPGIWATWNSECSTTCGEGLNITRRECLQIPRTDACLHLDGVTKSMVEEAEVTPCNPGTCKGTPFK